MSCGAWWPWTQLGGMVAREASQQQGARWPWRHHGGHGCITAASLGLGLPLRPSPPPWGPLGKWGQTDITLTDNVEVDRLTAAVVDLVAGRADVPAGVAAVGRCQAQLCPRAPQPHGCCQGPPPGLPVLPGEAEWRRPLPHSTHQGHLCPLHCCRRRQPHKRPGDRHWGYPVVSSPKATSPLLLIPPIAPTTHFPNQRWPF